MHRFDPDVSAQACLEIIADAQRVGFAESEAEQFADFTLGVRPTYAQICTWLTDLEKRQESPEDIAWLNLKKELYDRIRNRLGEIGTNNSMGNSLIRGTVAHSSEYKSVGGVWPEHAAATFIIEDYDFDEHDNLLVNKIKIILGIDSTQSAPRTHNRKDFEALDWLCVNCLLLCQESRDCYGYLFNPRSKEKAGHFSDADPLSGCCYRAWYYRR